MPFHAAEQHNKERKNVLAEHPARGYKLRDFPKRPVFTSSGGQSALGGPAVKRRVNDCPFFWFVFFGQTKKMNRLLQLNKHNIK
jgi:hypothetical protein